MRTKPLCFDSWEQWNLYVEAARAHGTRLPPKHEYCTDCTPSYKMLMMDQKRCEHKDVRFIWVKDAHGIEDIEGRRTKHLSADVFVRFMAQHKG